MEAKNILISGTAATSVMTAFSYLLSEGGKKNYREPELLASLLANRWPAHQKRHALPAGIAVHYALGVLWAMAHALALEKIPLKPKPGAALLLGSFSGITGVIIWRMLFKSNPQPPKIDYQAFYLHMFFAQLIFTSTVLMFLKNR